MLMARAPVPMHCSCAHTGHRSVDPRAENRRPVLCAISGAQNYLARLRQVRSTRRACDGHRH